MSSIQQRIAGAALCAAPALAAGQLLTTVSVDPGTQVAGQPTVITANFDLTAGGANCGVRVRYSDGTPEEYHRINQLKDVPLVLQRSFTHPGDVTIWVEPRTRLPSIKCGGGDRSAVLKVLPAAN